MTEKLIIKKTKFSEDSTKWIMIGIFISMVFAIIINKQTEPKLETILEVALKNKEINININSIKNKIDESIKIDSKLRNLCKEVYYLNSEIANNDENIKIIINYNYQNKKKSDECLNEISKLLDKYILVESEEEIKKEIIDINKRKAKNKVEICENRDRDRDRDRIQILKNIYLNN